MADKLPAQAHTTGDDELLIIELDERLEFGVAAIGSIMRPDDNSNCSNGMHCSNQNAGACGNAISCA